MRTLAGLPVSCHAAPQRSRLYDAPQSSQSFISELLKVMTYLAPFVTCAPFAVAGGL
jgi:hypothetical protein